MQIILTSAKIMKDKVKSLSDINLSIPRFQSEAECFARDMAQYSAETIAEILSCSQQIAVQNRLRYLQFFDEVPKLPAIVLCSQRGQFEDASSMGQDLSWSYDTIHH